MSVVRLRCAIYTRKSSEEGLEQNFNSLHAQREACEAYVLSQAGEGWNAIKTAYDDGGYSGGSMDRPGLQQLMADIQRGLVEPGLFSHRIQTPGLGDGLFQRHPGSNHQVDIEDRRPVALGCGLAPQPQFQRQTGEQSSRNRVEVLQPCRQRADGVERCRPQNEGAGLVLVAYADVEAGIRLALAFGKAARLRSGTGQALDAVLA